MTPLTQLKLGLAIVGLILWGYGARADVSWLRWTGIGFLAAAAALRFWRRRAEPDEGKGSPPES